MDTGIHLTRDRSRRGRPSTSAWASWTSRTSWTIVLWVMTISVMVMAPSTTRADFRSELNHLKLADLDEEWAPSDDVTTDDMAESKGANDPWLDLRDPLFVLDPDSDRVASPSSETSSLPTMTNPIWIPQAIDVEESDIVNEWKTQFGAGSGDDFPADGSGLFSYDPTTPTSTEVSSSTADGEATSGAEEGSESSTGEKEEEASSSTPSDSDAETGLSDGEWAGIGVTCAVVAAGGVYGAHRIRLRSRARSSKVRASRSQGHGEDDDGDGDGDEESGGHSHASGSDGEDEAEDEEKREGEGKHVTVHL